MNGNELLEKIDLLIDQGNMVWESPGRDANRDITRFCGAVKGLVEEVYGTEHPFVQKHTDENKEIKYDLGEGMSVLKSLRMEVEYSSQLGH